MLLRFLHKLAAHPWVYDRIQLLAGAGEVYHKLQSHLPRLNGTLCVLDVGGGTGTLKKLWPKDSTYICLDIDPAKLRGFREKEPLGLAVLADALRMPFADRSIDVLVCMFVAHHLDEKMFGFGIREFRRVLKPCGTLLFLDPLRVPDRALSRVLWAFDRGECPRTADCLRGYLETDFRLTHWETFTIYHQYILGVAEVRAVQETSL
jgi:ubiquinone/menaquinone biosynthesis C-methylase UbiE